MPTSSSLSGPFLVSDLWCLYSPRCTNDAFILTPILTLGSNDPPVSAPEQLEIQMSTMHFQKRIFSVQKKTSSELSPVFFLVGSSSLVTLLQKQGGERIGAVLQGAVRNLALVS